jgi:hypothetical protein
MQGGTDLDKYSYTTADLEGREDICIEDFSGNSDQGGFWADWDGQRVWFGGTWQGVPDMPTPDGTVNEDQVTQWVDQHSQKEATGRDDTSDTQDIPAGGVQGTAVPDGCADQHLL